MIARYLPGIPRMSEIISHMSKPVVIRLARFFPRAGSLGAVDSPENLRLEHHVHVELGTLVFDDE